MSTKNDDPKITAKRGANVRLVHRPTENAWKLWEMDTNKMVVYEAFKTRGAAVQFAVDRGWTLHEVGKRERTAATTKAPAASKARKGGKSKTTSKRATKAAARPGKLDGKRVGSGHQPVARPSEPEPVPAADKVA